MFENIINAIREKTDFVPKVAIVLGSGLGALADEISIRAVVDYNDIPDFPISTVEGHKGRFVFGYIGNTPVVIMQGRIHYYEGYDMEKVVLPIRIMRLLGAEILMLTNAAGGIGFDLDPGDLMIIKDHISFFVPSPLRGKNIEELGVRFPDMTNVYDRELIDIIKKKAGDSGVFLKEGIYAQTCGPNFETPAEVKLLEKLGADAVGMSTVCEAIAAKHCGMRVCGISCISNLAAGMTDEPLSHKDVQDAADKAAPLFKKLIKASAEAFGGLR